MAPVIFSLNNRFEIFSSSSFSAKRHQVRNPTIYNMIHWFAGRNGSSMLQALFSLQFLRDLGYSKLFIFVLEKIRKEIEMIFAKNFA